MNFAIETCGLSKFYRHRCAVQNLTWQVPRGAACAFLGPNGAGKSTTLKMLMGFTPPSGGSSRVLGEDPWEMTPETKARIGYVPEQPILPPWMRVGETVRFHSSFYPRWNARRERELRDLFEIRDSIRISDLSKGQHGRLMILLALCQGSELLILDEPAASLDVGARRQFLGLLGEFLSEGEQSLLFSTHLVTDVERIASHVAILDRGKLVEFAPLEELQEEVKLLRIPERLFAASPDRWSELGILRQERSDGTRLVTVRRYAEDSDPKPAGVQVMDLPLEDIFLAFLIRP